MTDTDSLTHYGVPGMRWGKRKGSSSSASSSSKSKGKSDKEDISKMSDEELKKRVARLNLEKQYRDLTDPSKGGKTTNKGAKAATNIMGNIGKSLVTSYAIKYATKGIDAAIQEAMKPKPKNGQLSIGK